MVVYTSYGISIKKSLGPNLRQEKLTVGITIQPMSTVHAEIKHKNQTFSTFQNYWKSLITEDCSREGSSHE